MTFILRQSSGLTKVHTLFHHHFSPNFKKNLSHWKCNWLIFNPYPLSLADKTGTRFTASWNDALKWKQQKRQILGLISFLSDNRNHLGTWLDTFTSSTWCEHDPILGYNQIYNWTNMLAELYAQDSYTLYSLQHL